jgi:hypothetical protein
VAKRFLCSEFTRSMVQLRCSLSIYCQVNMYKYQTKVGCYHRMSKRDRRTSNSHCISNHNPPRPTNLRIPETMSRLMKRIADAQNAPSFEDNPFERLGVLLSKHSGYSVIRGQKIVSFCRRWFSYYHRSDPMVYR